MNIYASGTLSYRLPDLNGGSIWEDMEWPSWTLQGQYELRNELELGTDCPPWDQPNGVTATLHENEYYGADRWGRISCSNCDAWPCYCGYSRNGVVR